MKHRKLSLVLCDDPEGRDGRGGVRLRREGLYVYIQLVKNPPAMQETPVRFLGQEDPLQKGQATHSSILGLPLWFSW